MTDYPPCFPDAEAYETWARHAKRVRGCPSLPCDDCTHAYREQMTREGRCDPQGVAERFRVAA